MTPGAILARLEKGFELLSGGARDMPERHQTMRHAIEWSHGLLPAQQQDLFARLAVFAGGCTLSAVEQVCADGTLGIDAIDGTQALLDASFLMRDDASFPGSGAIEPRLRMLETVRELALERLLAAPDDLAARMLERHREWAVSFATTFGGQLTGPGQRHALASLGADKASLYTQAAATDPDECRSAGEYGIERDRSTRQTRPNRAGQPRGPTGRRSLARRRSRRGSPTA